jgi:hypothetical protein
MAKLFEEERKYPDNKARKNFVFLGYPSRPPIPLDDYRKVIKDIEKEIPVRLWYFLDELTTEEMMRKIWRAILRSDLSIFDISGGNPNVAFELGLAIAVNKTCITLLKTGDSNPLGSADLGYAERAEYTSASTLKDKLRSIINAKSSAIKLVKDITDDLYPSGSTITREDFGIKLREIIQSVYKNKKMIITAAQKIIGDVKLARAVLNALREKEVLKVEGIKRAARWVFTDEWVHHDHEVTGA